MVAPEVNADECVGCGTCESMCPDCFRMDDEKSWVDCTAMPDGCDCEEIAEACPVGAISCV